MFKTLLSLAIVSQFFIGCGSSGQSSSTTNETSEVKTGVFSVTNPVANLHYSTRGFKDEYTNDKGEFNYYENENIEFDVFGVAIGQAKGQANLNPFNLAVDGVEGTTTYASATGAATLLLSLDSGSVAGEILTLDNAVKVYQLSQEVDLTSLSSITSVISDFSLFDDTTSDYSVDTSVLSDVYDYVSDLLSSEDAPETTDDSTSILDTAYDFLFGGEDTPTEEAPEEESSLLDDAIDFVLGDDEETAA